MIVIFALAAVAIAGAVYASRTAPERQPVRIRVRTDRRRR